MFAARTNSGDPMTRFLSKSCPSAASTGRKLWESGGLRPGGKRPELGACPAPTGAPDRTRTCAHGSGSRCSHSTGVGENTTLNCTFVGSRTDPHSNRIGLVQVSSIGTSAGGGPRLASRESCDNMRVRLDRSATHVYNGPLTPDEEKTTWPDDFQSRSPTSSGTN